MKHIQIQNITLQRKSQRGMTMIEVAIAVGLSTILVIMLYGTFWAQITQLRTQDIRSEMHQNGRFALESWSLCPPSRKIISRIVSNR